MPPMNFFDGALKLVDGELIFEEGKLENARAASPATEDGKSDEPVVMVGELTLPGNGFKVALPPQMRDVLAGKVGQHVVLGIRPEHFHFRPIDGLDGKSVVKVKLNVIEPLGNDMDLYMNTGLNDHVVARVEAQTGTQIGSEVTMYVDTRKVHVFEPGETGMNLSLKGAQASAGQSSETAHALA
jgi:ABC-type sugar transport system ATPase subunit